MLAGSKEDHRHADSFGCYRSGQGAIAEEVHPQAADHVYRQPADFFDRDGGMFGYLTHSSQSFK